MAFPAVGTGGNYFDGYGDGGIPNENRGNRRIARERADRSSPQVCAIIDGLTLSEACGIEITL